jgi:chemotaxis protein histidine kinase CheA
VETKDFSGIRTGGALPNAGNVKPPDDMGDLLTDYIESTSSLLDELERAALAYESKANRQESAAAIRRTLHKMKGESSMVGMDDLSEMCHQTESAFDGISENKRVDMILRFTDWVFAAMEALSQANNLGGH